MPLAGDILLEFDRETQEYLAVWEPVVFGMGKTEPAAMQDLIAAAGLFIEIYNQKDTVIKED